jgi:TP901 family phage tail tape measure protein
MPFTLTAALKVTPPSNINKIVADINRKLKSVNVDINLGLPANAQRQLAGVSTEIKKIGTASKQTKTYVESLGTSAAASVRRFAGFTIFASTFYSLSRAIKDSLGEAISFQREVVKIRQVSGTSLKDLKALTDEVTRLSTQFGVSSKRLLNSAQILAQAGFSADKTRKSLETLALVELAPTFDDVKDATEGMIAIFSQFKNVSEDFKKEFGSINSVAAKFAVESSDIITAIRRTGGAFAAAGGNLHELNALFTSVRATTRESAETISTGFRTIFTRLQRTRTIDFLKRLGIELRNSEQQFVGPYEAIKRLSAALNSIPSTDVRFAQITEELGGFRQIGKVIPLIKQFNLAEQARIVSQRGENSLTEDATKAQDALAIKIAKVKEEFQALIRTVADNDVFKELVNKGLQLSSILIKLAASLDKVLPLLLAVGATKAGAFGAQFLPAFAGGLGFKGHTGNKALAGAGIGLTAVPALISSFSKLDKESQAIVGDFQTVGATVLALNIAMRSLQDQFGQGEKLTALKDARGPIQAIADTLKAQIGKVVPALNAADFEVANATAQGNSARGKISKFGGRIQNQINLRQSEIGSLDTRIINEQARRQNLGVALGVAKQAGNISGAIAATQAITNSQNREQRYVQRRDTAQQNLGSLQGRLSGLHSAAKTADEARNSARERQKTLDDEHKALNSKLQLTQKELDATDKQIKAITRSEQAFTIISVAGTALAGALIGIGQFVERQEGAKLRGGFSGAKRSFAIGRGLSGAGQGLGAGLAGGAGIGAGIGALGGPIGLAGGAAIGAGLGAVIGGLHSFTQGLKEATDILESAAAEKNFNIFKKFLDNVQGGKTFAGGGVGQFRGGINLLQQRLENASIEGKETAQGQIDNAIVGIENFLVEIAKTTDSFEDLELIVGTDVLEKFALFTNLPFSKIQEQFEKQIESQKALITQNNILSVAQEGQLKRVQLFNNLSAALQDSIDGLRSFSGVLDKTTIKDLSGVFGRHESLIDRDLVSKAVGQLGDLFGPDFEDIGNEFVKTSQVLSSLPAIIIQASSKTFSESKEFIDDFEDALLNQFPDIPDILRAIIKSKCIEVSRCRRQR